MDILYSAVGLILLMSGGELLVRGSVSLVRRAALIGLTLVGFGTSTPELITACRRPW